MDFVNDSMDIAEGSIALDLELDAGGKTFEVRSGDIKSFDVQLANHGWRGVIVFDVFDAKKEQGVGKDDKLHDAFVASAPIMCKLGVKGCIDNAVEDVSKIPDKVTLRAVVLKRSFCERPEQMLESALVTVRRYRIEVADVAAALWGQHHPCQLYAKQTMPAILKEHAENAFTLEFDDSFDSESPLPMVFFALDPSIGKASFYDFFAWWLDRHRLLLDYRYRADGQDCYTIRRTKSDTTAVQRNLWRRHVVEDGVFVTLPEVPRHVVNVIDTFTGETIGPRKVSNTHAVTPMRRDTLLRTGVADSDFGVRADLETQRLVTEPTPELTVRFGLVPAELLFPGDLVKLTKQQDGWSSDSWQFDRSFRVFAVKLKGEALDMGVSKTLHMATESQHAYKMSLVVQLEPTTDTKTPRLPSFVEPVYPVHVEGKILSALGKTEHRTYETPEGKGGFTYRVAVPLGSADGTLVEITVPFNPGRMPGQLFYPAYKDERVVLAMTWRKAWIDSFVDWRDDIGMKPELTGNHMLLGKTPQSRTSLVNYYKYNDSEEPVFKLARLNQNDRQKIVLTEGNLLIEVNEESEPLTAEIRNVSQSEQD